MAEQGWTPSKPRQKLMKLGFMLVTLLEACPVPEDLAFPMPMEEYVVPFAAFYEQGFIEPPHEFLCSFLWYYGLELHDLTPSGVLHIVAFMTLCVGRVQGPGGS
jgi:hypothetical protein